MQRWIMKEKGNTPVHSSLKNWYTYMIISKSKHIVHSIIKEAIDTYYSTGDFDEIFVNVLIYCCVPKQLNHSAPFKGNGAMRGKVFSVKFKVRLYGK